MKVLVRSPLFQQPHDRLCFRNTRCAAINQRVQRRTDPPGQNHRNVPVLGELQMQFVLSSHRKNGMGIERGFFLKPFELLEELDAF